MQIIAEYQHINIYYIKYIIKIFKNQVCVRQKNKKMNIFVNKTRHKNHVKKASNS